MADRSNGLQNAAAILRMMMGEQPKQEQTIPQRAGTLAGQAAALVADLKELIADVAEEGERRLGEELGRILGTTPQDTVEPDEPADPSSPLQGETWESQIADAVNSLPALLRDQLGEKGLAATQQIVSDMLSGNNPDAMKDFISQVVNEAKADPRSGLNDLGQEDDERTAKPEDGAMKMTPGPKTIDGAIASHLHKANCQEDFDMIRRLVIESLISQGWYISTETEHEILDRLDDAFSRRIEKLAMRSTNDDGSASDKAVTTAVNKAFNILHDEGEEIDTTLLAGRASTLLVEHGHTSDIMLRDRVFEDAKQLMPFRHPQTVEFHVNGIYVNDSIAGFRITIKNTGVSNTTHAGIVAAFEEDIRLTSNSLFVTNSDMQQRHNDAVYEVLFNTGNRPKRSKKNRWIVHHVRTVVKDAVNS